MRYVQCRAGGVGQTRGRGDRAGRCLGQIGRNENCPKFEQSHERSPIAWTKKGPYYVVILASELVAFPGPFLCASRQLYVEQDERRAVFLHTSTTCVSSG
jgi:hypothetical protein